ncbi:hypothetical protein [Kitasatospora sp. NPDC057223]|uniref:hypothetical protein n=1 Tax=Kitasatospora sp. NPDC057223 TaxID=3346055 RepID=UPI003634251E
MLPRLAKAVGTTPDALCTVEHETLAHLRIFTGRSRAAMATELDMAEETYRQLETTGQRGRLARSLYSEDRWITWQEWAPPKFGVAADRLAAAEQHTQEQHRAEREQRWQRLRRADPDRAAHIEELGRAGRALRGQ